MKRINVFFFTWSVLVMFYSCQKGNTGTESTPSSKPILAVLPSVSDIGLPESLRDKIDETKLGIVTHPIYLPNNCSNGFAICNVGPVESNLDYSIVDAGGYFNFNNRSGSLKGGTGVAISVAVQPSLISGFFGTSSLIINTPSAGNSVSWPVSFQRLYIYEQAKTFVGKWSGVWSGTSFGANNPGLPAPATAVNGSWTLDVQSIDTTTGSASGTLTWAGSDAYWVYILNGAGNIISAMPAVFTPAISLSFNNTNATFKFPVPGSACFQYHFTINDNLAGSSYGNYGPRFDIDVNLVSNTLVGSSTFVAWPYAPVFTGNLSSNQSNGKVTGRKN